MSKEKVNGDALLKDVDIVDIISDFVSLKQVGTEMVGLCPFHNDDRGSLQVSRSKQIYKCFACDAGGDAIEFLREKGYTFHKAVDYIKGDISTYTPEKKQRNAKISSAPKWKQIMPPEPPREIRHYEHGKPSRTWTYRTSAGKLIGYVCRFDHPDGRKDVIPYTYATNGERKEWRWLGFQNPRPLFQLDKIAAKPDAMVMIVEGEKTAEAAQKLFPSLVVTCWVGGSKAIHETDWAPLYGRKIIVWPDNDIKQQYGEKHEKAGQVKPWEEQPGNKAMIEIEAILKPHCPIFRWVRNSPEFPHAWDVADAKDWTPEIAGAYVKANIFVRGQQPPSAPKPEAPEPQAAAPVAMTPAPPADQPPATPVKAVKHKSEGLQDQPFRFLGFDKTDTGGIRFHFFVEHSRTVVSLSHASLGKSSLMSLAPLNWWENNFPGKQGLNQDAAQQYIHVYGSRKPYTDKHVRGRGAWMEGDKVVLHAGESLIVNGKEMPISDHESKFIYEVADELGFHTENPLLTQESARLMEVLKLMNWERPVNPYLIAGWMILAPVCGALKWRPHIWVTGGAGVGKSWFFRDIVAPLLGESALRVQSETTEAGIRQVLRHDALPVVFDEAEGNERKDIDRIQTILNLVRAASAEDTGMMAKGSAGGTAKTYRIRSCFAFASIAVGVSAQSDRSRVSVLGITQQKDPDKAAAQWKKLQEVHHEVVTPEFCARLRARTIKILPIIIENTRTFARAVAAELGEQRAGDQLGTLLAGQYSLISEKRISYPEACEYVAGLDWSEERQAEGYRDENRCLQMLMETSLSIESAGSRWDRQVGELIELTARMKPSTSLVITELIDPIHADDRLRRFGIVVKDGFVYFSNTSDQIRKRLENTPWSKNHNKILSRVKTAALVEPMRFAPGVVSRAVRIDLAHIMGNAPVNAHSPEPQPAGPSSPDLTGDGDDVPF